MKTAFKKALIAFLAFILILIGILIAIVQHWSQYADLTDTMQMVDFPGILLAVFSTSILMLTSIGLIFWLAHAWSIELPELGQEIIRLATIVSILLIVVFGGLGGGLIVMRTLATSGYF